MEIARDEWEKEMENKDVKLSQEIEEGEQLKMRNKKLEEDSEHKSQQISQLQSQQKQQGGDGGSVEKFFGSLVGSALATAAYYYGGQRVKGRAHAGRPVPLEQLEV
ncbi:hypothetical protein OS493_034924 [Desmophyllum pertusum]|uniref:Uncharacterized protein n=1 Tax=Desmophyllum pertusum TaxID=174260 RepID=A0A9W9Z7K2_9CNID|nr:hypothetical protein OS493_034924 [Desmophyllum pertusum]